jgi:hypothetical protein
MTGATRRRAAAPTLAAMLVLLATLVVLPLVLAPRAEAFVYWTWNTSSPTTQASGIGRANLDGTGVNESFIAGVAAVTSGVAVDGAHVYWASLFDPGPAGSAIGRANLDGTGVAPTFITGIAIPGRLAVDTAHIYWTSTAGIGRANLDGSGVDESFIDPSTTRIGPISGVAVSADHIYWAISAPEFPPPPAGNDAIGCANLDGTGVNHGFITVRADDVAVDGAHIYWTNGNGIGRANLDGTEVNESFITGGDGIHGGSGIAVDGAHLYWGNLDAFSANDTLGRANLDGTGVDQSFITAGGSPLGVAVDGPPPGPSGPSSCPPPPDDDFRFGKLKRNLKKGTAKLAIRVAGPGQLGLAKSKRLRSDSKQPTAAGKVRLRVRPRKKAKAKLANTGKVKVRLKVTYTPTWGEPNTKPKKVKLKRAHRVRAPVRTAMKTGPRR